MAATTDSLKVTRQVATSGVLSALAVVLAFAVRFPLLPAAPYLTYEPSDVPLLLGAFRLSPLWVTAMSGAVTLVMWLTGDGGVIGAISRFVGSASLALTAAWVYRWLAGRARSKLISVVVGILVYTLAEVALTFVLGPLFFGDLQSALAVILPVVVPFNVLKGTINGAAALLVDSAVGAVARARGGQ
ncbi:riboflavin transporter FmnP [Symbiobacterium terraclitae]|jgi:riboflavin transporter FmnP|uniref:Riboflavin transporter n=1 Tax=Symbiobacterium terraclitae TaxID=557451 RepID=A0ABS4JRC7_9FIRM|nr:ECF transporter S component [Symbiobacterium terraclitae]MBP2017446.1 riboflavin transporter FmnP [Symbiobacterium terraclitae]